MSGALQEQIEPVSQRLYVYEGPIEQIAILATHEAFRDTIRQREMWDPLVEKLPEWEQRFYEPVTDDGPQVEALLGFILQYVSPDYPHRSDSIDLQRFRNASSIKRQP